jgi:hypothetical protein
MRSSRRIRPSRQPRSIGNNEIRGLAQAGSGKIRSRGAISLGILLAIGTIVVLFWDVRAPTDITTDHVMTLAMLVVTIAAGHYWLPAVQQRRVLPAIGLAILFIAGTFVCVTGSAGRGAEVAQRKAAAAGNINEARKEVADQLAKARADRAALTATMNKECASGEGPKCRGSRASVEYADSHIAILEVRKNDMAPEEEANVRLKHAARVFAFFNPGADVRRIEQGLELIWPFALALIMELGTIVFLSLGLGHESRLLVSVSRMGETVSKSAASATVSNPATVSRKQSGLEENAEVVTVLRSTNKPLTNGQLAALMGVTKGEASKRRKRVSHLLKTERSGREVRGSLLERPN